MAQVLQPRLTFSSVSKGQSGVSRTESVSQHFLLVRDDGFKHGLVLDLSGRNHDAAVHEVCDGVGQIFVILGQERFQAEHLMEEVN